MYVLVFWNCGITAHYFANLIAMGMIVLNFATLTKPEISLSRSVCNYFQSLHVMDDFLSIHYLHIFGKKGKQIRERYMLGNQTG